jgi:hypothetical protein
LVILDVLTHYTTYVIIIARPPYVQILAPPLRGTSFFFLLRVRIFIGLSVASIVAASPSGYVLGGSSRGHAGESTIIGIDQGLDRIFEFSSGVFVVKLRDSVVISFSLSVLLKVVSPLPI